MQPPIEIPLWPASPPDSLLQHDQAEVFDDRTGPDQRLNRMYASVTQPALTFHPPTGSQVSRAAVIVFPGGGYREVWIDKEGHDIARWLNTLGLTAFVVKYRTAPASTAGASLRELPEALILEVLAASLADGQRAIRLVRQRSPEWQIDPDRLGAIGFSAGGHLILRLLGQSGPGDPASADPVERLSSKPDFSILAYPGVQADSLDLPANTGPVFIAQGSDDTTTPAPGAVQVLQALLDKNIPVEAHFFRHGRHGFGLGIEGGEVRGWTSLCEGWLRELGYLAD